MSRTEQEPLPEAARTKTGDVVADALAAQGVETTFGLLGSGTLRIVGRLTGRLGVRFVNARHESSAVSAADAFARVTGEVGVCLVTEGPGVTNTVTALVTAAKAHTPLLLVTGDSSGPADRNKPFRTVQSLDQRRLLGSIDVPVLTVRADRVHTTIAEAYARARDERRPVAVAVPHWVQHADAAGNESPVRLAPQAPRPPDPAAVGRAADLISRCRRPVVLAGLGAVHADARQAVEDLADHVGALLATSLRAKGFFSGNPWSIGVSGGYATPPARELLHQADGVIALGAALNDFTTGKGRQFADDAVIIQGDLDPAALGAHNPVTHGLVGDARLIAETLVEELRGRGGPREGFRKDGVAEPARVWREEFDDQTGAGLIDPRALCQRLDEVLPHERTVVTDGGHFCLFPTDLLDVPDPRGLVFPLEFGVTGGGMGSAFGAALGRPDRPAVLFIGDGGLLMTLGELEVAVREAIPLAVFCLNDGAYGSEVHIAWDLGLPDGDAIFGRPDVVSIARSMGADALRVTDPGDVAPLRERLADLRGPLVVDCPIPRTVLPRLLSAL